MKSAETSIAVEIELVTNGVLTDEKISFILEKIDSVTLSYDGLPELQLSQRRCTDQQIVMIEKFLKRMSESNFNFVIRSTVILSNEGLLPRICDFLFPKYNGLKHIIFEPVSNSGRAEKLKRNGDVDFLKDYLDAYSIVLKKYPGRMISCSLFPNTLNPSICSAWLGRTPWIDAEGYIMPCNERISHDEYAFGKIGNEGSLEWYDPKRLESNLKTETDIKECKYCLAYHYCRGGCPIVFQRNEFGQLKTDSGKEACYLVRRYWTTIYRKIACGTKFLGFEPKVLLRNGKTGKPSIIKINEVGDGHEGN